MIWFNIKSLEKRLLNGEVSDKLAFNYLLTHLIFLIVASHLGSNNDPVWSVWVHLSVSLVAVIWGMRKTFEINEQGGNTDYFKRFICISLVVGIRLLAFLFIVSLLVGTVFLINSSFSVSFFLSSFAEAAIELGFSVVLIGIYYYMLISSFKRINAREAVESLAGS